MKNFYLIFFSLCILCTGCTVNKETGTTSLFGVIPVSDSVIDVAETAADEAKTGGGFLGILGVAVGTGISLWRRRKELKAKDAAISLIDGLDEIKKKADDAQANGGEWKPTSEEIVAIVKSIQNSEGTRDCVKKLIDENV